MAGAWAIVRLGPKRRRERTWLGSPQKENAETVSSSRTTALYGALQRTTAKIGAGHALAAARAGGPWTR